MATKRSAHFDKKFGWLYYKVVRFRAVDSKSEKIIFDEKGSLYSDSKREDRTYFFKPFRAKENDKIEIANINLIQFGKKRSRNSNYNGTVPHSFLYGNAFDLGSPFSYIATLIH